VRNDSNSYTMEGKEEMPGQVVEARRTRSTLNDDVERFHLSGVYPHCLAEPDPCSDPNINSLHPCKEAILSVSHSSPSNYFHKGGRLNNTDVSGIANLDLLA